MDISKPLGIIEIFFLALVMVVAGGSILFMLDEIDNRLEDEMERLRSENIPTRYEYKVISVEKGKTLFFNTPYYDVFYIGADNVLITEHFETEKELRLIISNESKLVIENPELNGYPLRYTLYWEFT